MRDSKTINFVLKFKFSNFDDIIEYKTYREFYITEDIDDNVKNYVENWLKKFGSKYGICYSCSVYHNTILILTYKVKKNNIVDIIRYEIW